MHLKKISFLIVLLIVFAAVPPSFAEEPTVSIVMEKTTYTYCEKLFYIIEVSEVTGEPAIIHINDSQGKGSSAIPVAITEKSNPIPSLMPFEKEIFPLGKYYLDVQYSGMHDAQEFTLVDSDRICIPGLIKPIMSNWLAGNISDGFLVDAFQEYIDSDLISIPFDVNQDNVYDIDVPEWVKNTGLWWIQDLITDDELAQAINYLVDQKMISSGLKLENTM